MLNAGLQAHLIGPRLYALLVVTALFTTALAGPPAGPLRRPATPPPRAHADPAGTTVPEPVDAGERR
ncbi:hypothetical protein [Streptomyces sp. Tu 6176]|uniref:hypothetical protein n=1 Tax=Streptomyces sp. Tu 6176 TaxID=1470557 RepID=UPI00068702A0|nr:hypothetical protein [Streptomyces sp. Tu 6176]